MPFSFRPMPFSLRTLFAIAGALAIALSACTPPPAPPPPAPVVEAPPEPIAGNPTLSDRPEFLRLPNMPAGTTPVRVGIILPLSNANPGTRQLAQAMLNAAQLALFDSQNSNIILMSADEGTTPNDAAAAATRLLDQGAEILLGPLFGPSVAAVAPLARDRAVPVIAFSTDRSVAGQGAYLLSFLPQNEVQRVIAFAAQQGRRNFAGLIPEGPYGDLTANAFVQSVAAAGGSVRMVERFAPSASTAAEPADVVAKTGADAVFLPQGGVVLRTVAPILAFDELERRDVRLLGTGLWDDASLTGEPALSGAWFAAPDPAVSAAFNEKYKASFGVDAPQLATLSYDALSLVALLSAGEPYHRFTRAALTDGNGFGGVDGIFRFLPDGTSERGLAVLEISSDGFSVVSPAPTSFTSPRS